MQERRKVENKSRYILAFVIGTIIFLIGFGITYSVAYFEYQRVSNLQEELSYSIFEDKLQYTLFEEDICSQENYIEVSEDLRFQGGIIGQLEERFGKEDEDVLFRKKFYSLVQLEHFELVKLRNERCNNTINTILFFYSNEEEELEDSEHLGNILSVLFERNSESLIIYSFDVNLKSTIIQALKEKYGVDGPTKIVINEQRAFPTIENIQDIEPLLQ